ncbi:hypothetical protein L1987_45670 [Smallanthus sonchifolius]|uniref:Uncharacterized protein n=1 Tax=Smallanthus sonchifolius TaxID=185202 RepID=A0ACB9FXM3_9ASTR|nr:hypothetical protein L1987_45670 [Smallanthus sonchifolius]
MAKRERGDIYFFYRPRVGKEEPHSSDDVQRMYIVLRPDSSGETSNQVEQQEKQDEVNIEKSMLLRLIVMGKKSLPNPAKRSKPYWGFVELVTTKIQDIKDALKGARALGEGVYRILKHHSGEGDKPRKMHTHLIYKLEFPSEGAESRPQEELNVEREGSFLIQIKNPTQGLFKRKRKRKRKKKAIFPAHVQRRFGKLRYHAADPPDFLNYQGCEFLLISASDDIRKELGLEIEEDASCSDLVNTFGETASSNALYRGIWV